MRSTITRRDFFGHIGAGFGGVALSALLGREASAAPPPALPKARRVIQLFMNGGASQCDLFDYKPLLIARHGETFDPGGGSGSKPASALRAPSCAAPTPGLNTVNAAAG